MNQYEMMFLFDPAFATDFQQAKAEAERILSRSDAEVVFLEKWDERRLAYEIKGRKRGCYVLSYFKCDPGKIVNIERDAGLSEPVLRHLVKQANNVTPEQMQSFMPSRREEDGAPRAESGAASESASKPESAAKSEPVAEPVEVGAESSDAQSAAPSESADTKESADA